MDLRQLTTFRMVATTLSFSRTALALNYVQSSVTAQIQTLEEELGVPLFDRLGKRVALTEAGRQLLPYAERMLNLATEARNVVTCGKKPTGTLTISAPETLCTYRLPLLLRRFRDEYPQVRLTFRPYSDAEMRRSLAEGLIDVCFVIDDVLHSTILEIESLIKEEILLLASPDHPLAGLPVLSNKNLEGEAFLLTEAGCSYRNIFERALHQHGIQPTTHLEFSSVEAIKQCAIAAMGITFLPAVTVQSELAEGRLVALQWEDHCFKVSTQMLWHRGKWVSPALSAFLTMARSVLIEQAVKRV